MILPSLATKKIRRQLHVTAIDMLSICGVQFAKVYVEGQRKPPAIASLVGTSTHRTIHHDLRKKIDTGFLETDANVREFAAAAFEEAFKKEPVEPSPDEIEEGVTLGTAKDKAIALSSLHHVALAPKLTPVDVERKFSLSLDSYLRTKAKALHEQADRLSLRNRTAARMYERQAVAHNAIARDGCDLAGAQDVKEFLDASFSDVGEEPSILRIRDTKTSKKSPNSDAAEQSIQLPAYALASQVLDCANCGHEHTAEKRCGCGCNSFRGRLPDYMMLDYLVETPKEKKRYVRTLHVVPTQYDIDTFLARLSNAVYALHSGVFVPAKIGDWHCSERFCGFWRGCEYAKRPADWDFAEVAPLVTIQ